MATISIFYCFYSIFYPANQGHFVRVLGEIGDRETENEVVLLEHDCPHTAFSEAVLKCLPQMPWVITEKVIVLLTVILISIVDLIINFRLVFVIISKVVTSSLLSQPITDGLSTQSNH
jgi:hypothetical protein